jgi:hypothetical protein
MVQEKGADQVPQQDQYAQVLADLDQQVNDRVEDVQRKQRYVDEEGMPSMGAVKEAAYRILLDDCVVTSKVERSKKALTRGDLYFRVYANETTPGAAKETPGVGVGSIDDLGTVDRRAYEILADGVWDLTQGSRSGWIQKRLGEDEKTLMLCRCKIHRPTEKMLAVYLTDNENLIREDAVDKLVVSLMRRASVIRRDLDMVLTRHPKLRGPIAAQLSGELKKIQAELTLPATPEADGDEAPAAPAQIPAAV